MISKFLIIQNNFYFCKMKSVNKALNLLMIKIVLLSYKNQQKKKKNKLLKNIESSKKNS